MTRTLSIIITILLIILTVFLLLGLMFGWYNLSDSDDKSDKSGLILIDGDLDSSNNLEILGSGGYSDTIVFNEDLCTTSATCGDDSGSNGGGGDDKDSEDPECTLSSDCGTNYYDDNYCWFGNSYHVFNYFTCDNECNEHTRIEKIEDCLVGCDDATGNCNVVECTDDTECGNLQICDVPNTYQCVDVECVDNTDCDDSDDSTQDLCIGAGNVDSYCEYTPITCNINADCGFDDFIEGSFCQENDDVFQNYLAWICMNPGTVDSTCTFDLTPTLTEDCNDLTETCFEGVCHTISCFDDLGCDDGLDLTHDSCVNPGQADSYCDNPPITCHDDSICDDNDDFTVGTCLNPGQLDSSCEYTDIDCSNDLNCGTDGFFGNGVCTLGDIFKDYLTWTCVNPGTVDSTCGSATTPQLFETCTDDCVSGVCGNIACFGDIDCDDSDNLTLDTCLNPGQLNSSCEYTPVSCTLAIDCGLNDYVGDRFCTGEDVFQDFKTFTCLDPGTPFSSCTDNIAPQIVEDCIGATICNAGAGTCVKRCVDFDRDGYDNCTLIEPDDDGLEFDCDDGDDTIYPGAPEILDGKDNDCDGDFDEDINIAPIFGGSTIVSYHSGHMDSGLLTHTTPSSSDRLLIVSIHADDLNRTGDVSSVIYDGIVLSKIDSIHAYEHSVRGNHHTSMWYLVNPPTGNHNVEVEWTHNVDGYVIAALNYNNVSQVDPIGTSTHRYGDGSTQSVGIVTSSDNSIILAALSNDKDENHFSPMNGVTEIYDQPDGEDLSTTGGQKDAPTAGSYSIGWTAPSEEWGIVAVEIKGVSF
jgi:hypothetical protein